MGDHKTTGVALVLGLVQEYTDDRVLFAVQMPDLSTRELGERQAAGQALYDRIAKLLAADHILRNVLVAERGEARAEVEHWQSKAQHLAFELATTEQIAPPRDCQKHEYTVAIRTGPAPGTTCRVVGEYTSGGTPEDAAFDVLATSAHIVGDVDANDDWLVVVWNGHNADADDEPVHVLDQEKRQRRIAAEDPVQPDGKESPYPEHPTGRNLIQMSVRSQNEILRMLAKAEGELAKGLNLQNMMQEDAETDQAMCIAAGITLALKWVLGHIADPMNADDGFPIRNVDTSPAALAESVRTQAAP